MTLEMGFALAFLVAVITAVFGYGRLSNQVESQRETNANLWKVLGQQRETWERHEKESAQIRLEFSRRLSDGEAQDRVTASQYAEILRRLDELKKEFSEFRAAQK